MRQMNKKKITKFNYVHAHENCTYIRESDTPLTWEAEKRGKWGIYDILSWGWVRSLQREGRLPQGSKRRCSVISSLLIISGIIFIMGKDSGLNYLRESKTSWEPVRYWLSSAQNNGHHKVAHFGETCSELLH